MRCPASSRCRRGGQDRRRSRRDDGRLAQQLQVDDPQFVPILSRGTPNLENELWNVSAQVINGKLTPDAAAKQIQDGLDKWYKPAAK